VLAAGDVTADHRAELFIATPLEFISGQYTPIVTVLFGSSTGVTATGAYYLAGSADSFGLSMTVMNSSSSGYNELAVGARGRMIGSVVDAGAVVVLPGGPNGPTLTGAQVWSQATTNVPGVPESLDHFGSSLYAARTTGGTYDDLIIGVPYEDSSVTNEGAIQVLLGSTSGLTAVAGYGLFTGGDLPGGAAEQGDFGWAIA
jgi:hypothetical protein